MVNRCALNQPLNSHLQSHVAFQYLFDSIIFCHLPLKITYPLDRHKKRILATRPAPVTGSCNSNGPGFYVASGGGDLV